jgi:hypothetical protein
MTEKSRSKFLDPRNLDSTHFFKIKTWEKKHCMNIHNLIFNNKQILISLKIKYQIK